MSSRLALVYGGAGGLGRVIVSKFRQSSWKVISVDFKANQDASDNILLEPGKSAAVTKDHLSAELKKVLSDQKLDAIMNVAGGWAGGNLLSENLVENVDLMIAQSVHSSVISAALSASHLKDGGLLTLTGANAAMHGTPGMIGYGLAKAAVHQLIKSVAGPDSGFPSGARVVGILPITLDTEMNRKWMPNADFSTWTPLSDIADKFHQWASDPTHAPPSGTLLKLETIQHKTSFVPV